MGTLFTALGAAAALAGTDIIPVHQGGARAVGLTGAQLLTYVGGSYVGKTGAQSMVGGLTIASGSLATSAAALTITQTWNGVGQRFDAVVMDFTNTNSGNSYPYLIRVNGSEISYLTKTGDLFCNNLRTISNSGSIGFSTAGNVFLYRDGDGQLAMRNGANAQRIHIYGTSDGTPGSNYQRMVLSANGTTGVTIAAEGLGTPGANQDITLTPGGTGSVKFPGSSSVRSDGYFIGPGILCATETALNYYEVGVRFASTGLVSWTSGVVAGTKDTALARNAAGVVEVNNGTAGTWRDLKLRNLLNTEYHEMTEMTAPSAPATNSVRIYAEDNGAGKTRLMALFATGSAVQLGIEP